MMTDAPRTYLPAAGRDWALPLYDPLVKLLGGDAARRALIEQAELHSGHRILEIGCGTGALLMQIARSHPDTALTGLDPDPKALALASRKAERAGVRLRLDRGFSDALPYPDASFDRVFSCFMLHHVPTAEEKRRTLLEVRRVLVPGGRLHLLDFVQPEPRAGSRLGRLLHSHHHLEGNRADRVLALMHDAGLLQPAVRARDRMIGLLHVAYYEASTRADA